MSKVCFGYVAYVAGWVERVMIGKVAWGPAPLVRGFDCRFTEFTSISWTRRSPGRFSRRGVQW